MTDQELLQLLESDPDEGIHELMRLYGGAVGTICRNFLYDCTMDDVEEAIADTFIQFWKKRKLYQPDERHSIRSYLYAIARNGAIDRRRRCKKQEFFSLDEIQMELSFDDTPEQEVEKREAQEALHACLAAMTEPNRSVFLYRYFYGYGIADIAKRMGLQPKKVENILYQGKLRLKKALMERGITHA